MTHIYLDSPVRFEAFDQAAYQIITDDAEKALIGNLVFDPITKQWFLQLLDEYLVGPKTLSQIVVRLESLRWDLVR